MIKFASMNLTVKKDMIARSSVIIDCNNREDFPQIQKEMNDNLFNKYGIQDMIGIHKNIGRSGPVEFYLNTNLPNSLFNFLYFLFPNQKEEINEDLKKIDFEYYLKK